MGSTPKKIDLFLANWGAEKAKKWQMRQQNIFQNLSHSNGNVVFDHGPKKLTGSLGPKDLYRTLLGPINWGVMFTVNLKSNHYAIDP